MRQQRGGYLDEGDPALIASRSETDQITNDTATERNQGGIAPMPTVQQSRHDLVEAIQRLVGFAIRQYAGINLIAIQHLPYSLQIERSHGFIADHHDPPPANCMSKQLTVAQQARTNANRVTSISEIYIQPFHGRSVGKLQPEQLRNLIGN